MFFEALWQAGLAEYDDFKGIAWHWQSIDGAMMKAPLAREAVGPNPTERGKNGSKRHLLVDGSGVPLSFIVTGANRPDVTQLQAVLKAVMVKKPSPADADKHLCADAAYTGASALRIMAEQGYIAHVKGRAQEAAELQRDPAKKARRGCLKYRKVGSTSFATC